MGTEQIKYLRKENNGKNPEIDNNLRPSPNQAFGSGALYQPSRFEQQHGNY